MGRHFHRPTNTAAPEPVPFDVCLHQLKLSVRARASDTQEDNECFTYAWDHRLPVERPCQGRKERQMRLPPNIHTFIFAFIIFFSLAYTLT